ncbi:hypothetical protein Poli38472_000493 [Pythium oligandrum]|uniref:TLC domain-containing protein n=1 Tax=Pythium oligandrum TaxID=41045 RepID=A0A8K1FFE0_PYTOL|nr:hypothetical protein Poli38472_000493 [Pythium oligandrum]|eukprot:TMW60451.1 hypothetical protein Poli38472_000493 [Pythium oligandrum]
MLTEALVLTWFGMCAAMLYTDPRLWIVFASSIAFTFARVVGAPLVAKQVKAFSVMSDNNQLLWSNTIVSMVHSAVSSLLALSALVVGHSLFGDFVNRASHMEFVTTAISTGYFAYDLWDYVLNRLYIKSPGIVAHHVVILICYISALTKTVGVPLLSLALICELHSVFMHLRKLMSMSSYRLDLSSSYRLVWSLQWVSFLLARVIPHVAVMLLAYQGRELFSNTWFFAMAFCGIVFINALNTQLFLQVQGAYRKDKSLAKATKAT